MTDFDDALASIDNYRIQRKLGRGQTGAVYLADRIQPFEQRVAIKVLRARPIDKAANRNLIALDHPGAARFLDHGALANGSSYLVMEYVEGLPIDAFCTDHNLGLRSRIKLVLQAADALIYAHHRLTVHFNVKPEKVLVTLEGDVKILGLGLARFQIESAIESGIDGSHSGSYEQSHGVAADIHALGVLALRLIADCGERSPRDLTSVLQRACEASPEARYPTMREFADDLRAWLELRPVSTRCNGRFHAAEMWCRRNGTVAAMLSAVLLIVTASGITFTVAAAHAIHQRHEAQARLQELVVLTGILQSELYTSLPAQPAADEARRALLTHVDAALDELAEQTKGDRVLAKSLSEQYGNLAKLQESMKDKTAANRDLAHARSLLR